MATKIIGLTSSWNIFQGGTLEERLKHSQAIQLRDAITLILQACQALEYIHQQHIVHGDVKPSNMLFRNENVLLLSDVSIDIVQDTWGDGDDDRVLPSPRYIYHPPEAFTGFKRDQSSDLYPLGNILYEVVTGRVPFEGRTFPDLVKNILNAPLPPPRQFSPDLPPMVERLIIKALEKDPAKRYQSATEMVAALENIAGALGGPSRAAPAAKRVRPRVFVSHNHKNDDFTVRFVADLRAAGVEVWVDMVNMQYGDFITRINQALDTSEWLVLVLTPEAIASEPVKTEVHAAISRVWRKRMKGFIPFMAHPCDPETIPAMWDTFHRYDATSDYKRALAGLLRALGIE